MIGGRIGAALRRVRSLLGRDAEETADRCLLRRFVHDGDQDAFAALVERHGPMVLGVSRRVLRDDHRAEDVFQATFLVLARKAASLDCRGCLSSWLYAVAYHAALRARAGAVRRERLEKSAMLPTTESPRPEADWADVAPVLDAELHRLPEKYRAPLVLCYLRGRTNEEAAAELGWPSGTVKCRLARARDLLRDRLTRRGVTLSALGLTTLLTTETLSAAVPPALLGITNTSASGAASATALTLAEGVLSMLWWNKVKAASLWAVALLALVGVGSAARLALAARPPETLVAALTPLPPDEPLAREEPAQVYPLFGALRAGAPHDAKLPAVTVGRFPASGVEPLKAFTEGKLELLPARSGENAQLFVVGELLNSGETADVVRLTRAGNRFTLTAVAYRDNGVRYRNVPSFPVFQVSLGALDAGDYEVRVVWRGLHRDVHPMEEGRQPDWWFQLASLKEGTLRFTVVAKDAATDGAAPKFQADAFKDRGFNAAEKQRQWQRPLANTSSIVRPKEVAHPNGLQVGRYAGELGAAPATLEKVEPVNSTDPVCAVIVGPELNSGERMALREIEWKGNEAILRVDLWRDDGQRKRNTPFIANLVAPLQLPPRPDGKPGEHAAGEYKVRVEWTLLRAPNLSEAYAPEDPTGDAVKKLLADVLNVGCPATFTIK